MDWILKVTPEEKEARLEAMREAKIAQAEANRKAAAERAAEVAKMTEAEKEQRNKEAAEAYIGAPAIWTR